MSNDVKRYEGHTPGPWEWAGAEWTRERYMEYCAEAWDNADPKSKMFYVVQTDVDGENRTIAIIGNGPTAHINGPLIADAPTLAARVEELEAENQRLRDADEAHKRRRKVLAQHRRRHNRCKRKLEETRALLAEAEALLGEAWLWFPNNDDNAEAKRERRDDVDKRISAFIVLKEPE